MNDREAKLRLIGVVEKVNDISVIKIYPEYLEGLTAIEDFKEIMILFWMQLEDNPQGRSKLMTSRPRKRKYGYRGVFATHSPHRPNPIGVTVVELMKVEGERLFVKGLDAYQGTPIIDLKSA